MKIEISAQARASIDRMLPSLDGLRALLKPYEGQTAYLMPMTFESGRALGNNGDELMRRVFMRILDEVGIEVTDSADSCQLVIVPPNGALLEIYNFPDLLHNRLSPFVDLPLVIFPSSALFPTRDPAFIFEGRRADTLWILREENSLRHLEERWGSSLREHGVRLALDHDVVATGHTFAREIIGTRAVQAGLLVAARLDVEASTSAMATGRIGAVSHSSLTAKMMNALPHGRLKTRLARMARRRSLRAGTRRLLDFVERSTGKSFPTRPVGLAGSDLSSPTYATFAEYRRMIGGSSEVVTDRLHVALPAAIMGCRVFLVEAGYHKLEGVYQRSLTSLANVTLVK